MLLCWPLTGRASLHALVPHIRLSASFTICILQSNALPGRTHSIAALRPSTFALWTVISSIQLQPGPLCMHLLATRVPYIIASPGGDRLGTLSLEKVMQRNSVGGPLRLLFLANVTPLKGLHVLLDALSRLPAGTCTLDVAGSLTVDASYAKRMQEQAAALSSPVTFHGILDGAPLIDLLARSQVLVLPSFYEGFGIAYLEGMAFGLPAIGTNAGAIPQMIAHGDNGFLISPGDAVALANLIQGLAADRQLLGRLSSNALNYFHSCATWEQSAEKIRSFLLEMVSGAGLSRAK